MKNNVNTKNSIIIFTIMSEKVILLIMDGWGIGDPSDKSAVYKAKTPFYDNSLIQYPNSKLS